MTQRIACLILLLLTACTPPEKKILPPEWIQLFNGKDLNDWKVKIAGYPAGENYGTTFRVADHAIKVNYDQYAAFNDRFGHIFYKQKFSHYLIAVEYRFTGEQVKGGPEWAYRNSGIMLHGQAAESMLKDQDFPISLELQLLGGNGKEARTTANLCTPGTEVEMNGKLMTDHCINSTSATYHGDQWVRAEALVLGDSLIVHIVEGDTVLRYSKPRIGGGNVSNVSPAEKNDGKRLTDGYISLQSESHPVEFRKVELIDLSPYAGNSVQLAAVLRQLRLPKVNH